MLSLASITLSQICRDLPKPSSLVIFFSKIKRRQKIFLESSIWQKEATLQFHCWVNEKGKKTPGTDVYRAVENAYSCTYHFLRRFTNGKTYTGKTYIGNPNSCWKLHRTTDLMRNIPKCTSVCWLFQISKRKWISTTYDTWGTYLGNQIPQSSRGGYYYLRTLV